jgi:hypothetical protein
MGDTAPSRRLADCRAEGSTDRACGPNARRLPEPLIRFPDVHASDGAAKKFMGGFRVFRRCRRVLPHLCSDGGLVLRLPPAAVSGRTLGGSLDALSAPRAASRPAVRYRQRRLYSAKGHGGPGRRRHFHRRDGGLEYASPTTSASVSRAATPWYSDYTVNAGTVPIVGAGTVAVSNKLSLDTAVVMVKARRSRPRAPAGPSTSSEHESRAAGRLLCVCGGLGSGGHCPSIGPA